MEFGPSYDCPECGGKRMKAQINGKGFTALLDIEEGKVVDIDNESISVFKYKNWESVKERCIRYGWEVLELPEITLFDAVDPGEQIATYYLDWPFPSDE